MQRRHSKGLLCCLATLAGVTVVGSPPDPGFRLENGVWAGRGGGVGGGVGRGVM